MMHTFDDEHQVRVLQGWGMTETSPLGAVARPPADATGEEMWRCRYSQGRFPASVEARLTGDDGGFLPHDGIGTGDVGSITPDGYLVLSDRTKDIVKSGGEWISSVDLENAVMGHPAVLEAAVIGVPDTKWDERPLVAVVLSEGSTTTIDELREYLSDKVAAWQLPDNWTVIDEVPKTSVGKFDKKRLRADYHDGNLDVTRV